jgi:hypothetical protein
VVNHPVAIISHGQAHYASSLWYISMDVLPSLNPTLSKVSRHCLSIHVEPHRLDNMRLGHSVAV